MPNSQKTESVAMTRVIACEEVGSEFPTRVDLAEFEPLACYRIGDEYYVTADTCSHGEASLSDGEILSNGEVVCPFHNGTFDIKTGQPRRYPCEVPIRTYTAFVKEGAVWIEQGPVAKSCKEKVL